MRTFLIVVGITFVVWAAVIGLLYVLGRRMTAAKLARAIPDVLALFRRLMRDPATPFGSKLLVGLAFLYLVNPIDLIPEFIPVIGPFDDVIVTALVLRHLVKHAGRDAVTRHWRGDPATLATIFRLAGLGAGAA
ncbi:MAG: DUF1232 domain-containing protein [Actinomycetota bacterium]